MTAFAGGADLSDAQAMSCIYARTVESFRMLQGERREAALEFILDWDLDVPGDIAALSNPFSFAMSRCTRNVIETGPLPDIDPRTLPTIAINMDLGLMPVWCMGGVTVGVAVQRVTSAEVRDLTGAGFPPPVERGFEWGRWVRDEKASEFLLIMTSYGAGDCDSARSVTVSHWRDESSTLRSNHYMRCDWDMLRRSVRKKTPECFAASAVSSTVVSHRRECSICKMYSCSCTLPCVEPRGGLDFSKFRQNMALCNGEFGGVNSALVRRHVRGKLFQMSGQVAWKVQAHRGLAEMTELRDAAMQNRMLIGAQGNLVRGVVPVDGEVSSVDQVGPLGKEEALECEPGKVQTSDASGAISKQESKDAEGSELASLEEEKVSGIAVQRRRRGRLDESDLTPQQIERRRRNRESANRFNRNRAALILTLENSLSSMRSKEEQLLEKKRVLERENADMRLLLELRSRGTYL